MAQHFWQASDYTIGNAPAAFGWSVQAGTSTVSEIQDIGGGELAWVESRSSDGSRYYQFDAPGATLNDCQLYAVLSAETSLDEWLGGWYGDDPTDGYRAVADGGANTTVIQEFTSGSFDIELASTTGRLLDFAALGDKFELVFTRSGSDISLDLYDVVGDFAAGNPPSVTVTATDSSKSSKPIGLAQFWAGQTNVYKVGVGTGADSAPTAPTGPTLTVTQTELTPGGTISGSYSNYATVPTTLTVSDGTNTITIPTPTISDNGDGTGTFSGTMPGLPTSGTANLVLFGDVTVELT
ncbi:MAG: hypothetical protein Tp1111DCM1126091_123 [Prokaryotic dsDNA virus sp.]|nr:MAG: hypothetical protein Tp1111DCM1126091_123 [Prokaryotic dsDNA virus sp.]|tara:strand:- start:27742 stop:28626 length:885 start_codon:yes stop_codon:yes gene_type:complete